MRLAVAPVPFYEGKQFFESPSLPLAVIHAEPSPDYPLHSHDFSELVIVYGGSGLHLSPSGQRRIGPGDVYLIEPGSEHGYAESRELSYVNVLFDAPPLRPWRGRIAPGLRLSPYGIREALGLVARIDQELFRKEPGYELAAQGSFFLLAAMLARSSSSVRGESTEARVRALAERISRNSSLRLSVEDMAQEARTSPRNFRREFRLVTGESPVAFVNRRRLEEARALLRDTDKTVTQIAFLVGFEDSAYFARAFKRAEGRSPSDYRARFRDRGRA